MSLRYQHTFRVRHYECDAAGHLNHANYLRYMETAAFAASAAAGYDRARYDSLGLTWLIRETDIEYLRPLAYDDPVTVTTWVDDFRRVRSRRAYNFHHGVSGALMARASTDWVLIDTASGRPQRVPPALIAAFFPTGPPPSARRSPYPSPPPPPPGVYRLPLRVEWRDVDPAGHVNNAVYLSYMESAGMGVLRAYGWSMRRCREAGFALVARRFRLDYREQAAMDDELEVATWWSDRRRATAVRHYHLSRPADGVLIARGRGLWVWIDLATGQPIRIPEPFAVDFQPNASPD